MKKELTFKLSKHALEQMGLRGISEEVVRKILLNPDQIKIDDGKKVYQSLVENGSSLIRIFVNPKKIPRIVITVYKTSKIKEYYESKIW